MKRSLIPLSMFAGLALAGAAFANHHEGDDKFRKMDTNNDGRVTAAEHAAAAQQMFTMMDGNRDGAVTMEEMKMHKEMKKDGMHKDGMHKDNMRHEGMQKDGMRRDATTRDGGN
jgi:pentapeptide MXKDX repeat protein